MWKGYWHVTGHLYYKIHVSDPAEYNEGWGKRTCTLHPSMSMSVLQVESDWQYHLSRSHMNIHQFNISQSQENQYLTLLVNLSPIPVSSQPFPVTAVIRWVIWPPPHRLVLLVKERSSGRLGVLVREDIGMGIKGCAGHLWFTVRFVTSSWWLLLHGFDTHWKLSSTFLSLCSLHLCVCVCTCMHLSVSFCQPGSFNFILSRSPSNVKWYI